MIGFNDEILMDSLAEIGWSLRLVMISTSFVDEDILLLLLPPTVLRSVIPSAKFSAQELDEICNERRLHETKDMTSKHLLANENTHVVVIMIL